VNQPTGRVAIVTGAGRGIGARVAERLAGDGLAVGVLDLDEPAAKATAAAITARGGTAIAVGGDVGNPEQVEESISQVASELGPPTVLVSNAGVTRDALLFKMTESDWDTVINVHLRGAFLTTRAVQQYMTAAGWGRIVTISSTSALGNRGQVNYSAAKAGLQGFTKNTGDRTRQVRDHRQLRRTGLHRHRHDQGDRQATRDRLGRVRQRPGQPDHGRPGRPARRHRPCRVVLRQRGRRIHLRTGALRCRRSEGLIARTTAGNRTETLERTSA
jgi:NAD(P)-dependent dehydrogenase (short-subunit alcohol dehydrogenase family)